MIVIQVVKIKYQIKHCCLIIMGFTTTIAKASTIANSYRTTVPAAIMNQFNLKEGDKLDWSLKADGKELIVVLKPLK